MNEIEKENIIYLLRNHKNIRIHINEFCDFMNEYMGRHDIYPIADKNIMMQGFYATVYGCNIWVSKYITAGCANISNQNITNSRENKWSPNLPLNDIKVISKILKLKAFW